MVSIKRKQAEWIAQFVDTDIEIVLEGFDDVQDDDAPDADGPQDESDQDDADPDDAGQDDPGQDDPGQDDAPEAHTADDPFQALAGNQPHQDKAPPGAEREAKSGLGPDRGSGKGPDKDQEIGQGPSQEKGFASPLPVASPAIPVILLLEGAKYLTRELIATVTVTNDTEQTLTLDKGAQMAHGELTGKKPKTSLAPKESDTFTAHSVSLLSALDGIPVIEWLGKGLDKLIGSPSLAGVEGTLRYLVGDASTTWTCHFVFPRLITSSKEGKGTVAGQNPNGVQDQSQPPDGKDNWTFDLSGKGGGGGGRGQTAAAVTVRVTVINSSDQTIFLRHQENIGGEFVNNPKPKLGPNEQDNFVYTATATDKTRACRGKLFYDVADPKLVEWELLWDNQVNAKNLSASFLNPKDNKSGLHTLDQIDNGDENVPATYTLSGKGGGLPPPGKTGAYAVTMDNKTDAELTLTNSSITGGTLVPTLPAKLPAGASAQMQFTPDPAAKSGVFSAIWSVGQSGTGWHIKGTVPAGGDPAEEDTLDPANPKLSSTGKAAKTADGGTFNFVVSGGLGPVPPAKAGTYAVTMDNKTDVELALTNSNVTGGTLVPTLPAKLAAGSSAQMQFTPDPAAKNGVFSAIWLVGQSQTGWFLKGTVPAGGDPAEEDKLDPANPKLSSTGKVAKTGDGGTFNFVVSGTAAPPDKPDDQFKPPPKGKQPTLRKGDNNADGWVEYAQQLINSYKLGPDLPTDGDFSAAMDKFVKTVVQPKLNCQPDGVIGNETWSALREGPREAVGTDGRKPHTFEEKGPQARFFTEKSDSTTFDAASDFYGMTVVSTGEQPIDDFNATVEVTQPSGTSHTHKVTIGKAFKKSPDGQGDLHAVEFQPFSVIFKLEPGVTPDMCAIDAYLDGEIGGDRLTIPPKIKP